MLNDRMKQQLVDSLVALTNTIEKRESDKKELVAAHSRLIKDLKDKRKHIARAISMGDVTVLVDHYGEDYLARIESRE